MEVAAASDSNGMLRATVRAFLEEWRADLSFGASCDSWLSRRSPEFSAALGARGWIGMTWPDRYGGQGASPLARLAVVEELLVAGAPIAAHWFAERQVAPGLLVHGTEDQRNHFLPRIASGECFVAIGMSEPDAGSDLAAVTTRATRTSTGWKVNGTKIWTSGAGDSHYLLALVRTDASTERHGGLSQLLIPLDLPGISIRPIRTLDDEAPLYEVVLVDVAVDEFFLIGTPGQGWPQVMRELSFERSGAERYLSFFSLLSHLARVVESGHAEAITLGRLCTRLWSVRSLGWSVARSALGGGEYASGYQAAVVKDAGTSFERELIEECRRTLTHIPEARSSTNQAVLHSPSVTLRGGTSEVLRDVISRELATKPAREAR